MPRWLLLPMVVLASVVTSASAAGPRDRNRDGIPDDWERQHGLSTTVPSAGLDPDHDGLTNLGEFRRHTNPQRADTDRDGLRDGAEVHRYHTNPRRRDTDRDGLRDGAEVHRHHTNPRRKDTDHDGYSDRAEVRGGTNARDSHSHPIPSSRSSGGFPTPATTGTPTGWVPASTRSTDLTVTTRGAVVQDVRFTNGASIVVKANDVTIRRVDMQGGTITNQYGSAPANCGHDMLVEDSTFEQVPGEFQPTDFPVIGEGSYTVRGIEIDGRGEGPRASDCGPITVEDSFIKIHGADPGTSACDAVHSDGTQAYFGRGAALRHDTIIFQTDCGTAPVWWPAGQGNTGTYTVDGLLIGGPAGYSFRDTIPSSVRDLRIQNKSWIYGPLEADCSAISPWDARLVTIDADFKVTGIVRNLPCHD